MAAFRGSIWTVERRLCRRYRRSISAALGRRLATFPVVP